MKNFQNYVQKEFNFKKIFLELTQYTVPAGYEDTLLPILKKYIPNLKKDNIGNYYTEIGNSKTLFTSHLDTFSKQRKKINHIIDNNIIKTDETTVLGGDNKNGVTILLYMIYKKVPGAYFFFIGEESIVNGTGCYGSTSALLSNKEYFSKFNKAIAFDRRGKGSFVKRQAGRNCASDEFANAVISEFQKNGLDFDIDKAYRTDSAIFMDIIPEITNISSGGMYEHTFMEATDIDYVKKIAIIASKINWDNLPIVREISDIPNIKENNIDIDNTQIIESKLIFSKVLKLMGAKGFICLNKDKFQPGTIMLFDKFLEEKPVKLTIIGDTIKCIEGHKKIGRFRHGNFDEFKRRQKLHIRNLSRGIWTEIIKKVDTNFILSNNELINILNEYDISYDEFKIYMQSIDEKKYIQFNEKNIVCDIKILHHALKMKQLKQEQLLLNKQTKKEKQKEIKDLLKYLGNNWVILENANKTRFLKFIDNNNFSERFFGIMELNYKSGEFNNYQVANNINDLIAMKNIYDNKNQTLFIKK
jgi:hypothetical protein